MTTIESTTCLRAFDGTVLALPADRWLAPADPVDQALLDRVRGPVLDVGCGPGRHLAALRDRGIAGLGIDISPAFLSVARRRGLPVLERCVFDRVPGAGRWASALLLDGNIGIGGDPELLLQRLGVLLRPHGRLFVELGPDDGDAPVQMVRAEHADDAGPWFPWAVVGPRRLARAAARSPFSTGEHFVVADRRFVELIRR